MTPSHFAERLLANLSADHNKIVRACGWGGKKFSCKIQVPNLNNINILNTDRKYMYFLKATKLVTVCVHR